MQCTNCGSTLSEGTKFCGKCQSVQDVAPDAVEAVTDGMADRADAEDVVSEPPVVHGASGSAQPSPSAATGAATGEMPSLQDPSATVLIQNDQPENACSTCGAALLPGAKFCAKCGTVIGKSGTHAAAQTVVQNAPPQGKGTYAAREVPTVPRRANTGQEGPRGGASYQGEVPYYSPAGPGRDWVGEAMAYLPRIFKFDPAVYKELRSDPQATPVSILSTILGMFAFGLGGFLWTAIQFGGHWELFWKSALVGSLLGFVLFIGWVTAATGVLTYVYRRTVRFDEVLRVSGAATATLAVGFFMFIPGIDFGVALVAVALWVATSIFALQAAFDLEPRQAITASLAGFAVWALILPLIVTTNNPLGPGIMLFDWTKDGVVSLYSSYGG